MEKNISWIQNQFLWIIPVFHSNRVQF
jgi:hypothetical protein